MTDRDVEELKDAGFSEDEIFELGVIKTLHYRPEIFGQSYSEALDRAMRGPSAWSPGERELFAAFVSSLNQCPF